MHGTYLYSQRAPPENNIHVFFPLRHQSFNDCTRRFALAFSRALALAAIAARSSKVFDIRLRPTKLGSGTSMLILIFLDFFQKSSRCSFSLAPERGN